MELIAHYVPECPNKVAYGEYDQDHPDNPEEVAQHDLAHDIVVVSELLALEPVGLNDPLKLAHIVVLDDVVELLRFDQLKEAGQSQKLEQLQ